MVEKFNDVEARSRSTDNVFLNLLLIQIEQFYCLHQLLQLTIIFYYREGLMEYKNKVLFVLTICDSGETGIIGGFRPLVEGS